LKLIDHGHAFDPARAINSPFYLTRRGQEIPEEWAGPLADLGLSDLRSLLTDEEMGGFEGRLGLVAEGRLDVGEP
jgi:hypothetical protein